MFDTLAAARAMTFAGIEPRHAEAIATVAREAAEHRRYVTPALLDARLAALCADLRADFRRDLNALTWRLIAAGTAIVGLTIAVLRLLE